MSLLGGGSSGDETTEDLPIRWVDVVWLFGGFEIGIEFDVELGRGESCFWVEDQCY